MWKKVQKDRNLPNYFPGILVSFLSIYSSDKLSEELRELLNDSNNRSLFNDAFLEGIQKQGYLKGKYCYDLFDFCDFIFEICVKVNENGEIEKVFH